MKLLRLQILSLIAITTVTARFIDEFTVVGSGAQESPDPVYDTNGSAKLNIKFQEGLAAFEFDLTLGNIDGVTKAHLHCALAGVPGPLVVELFPTQAAGEDYTSFERRGIFTNADIIAINADDARCGVTINNVASFYEAVLQRKIYLNIHTVLFPNGELRGQIF